MGGDKVTEIDVRRLNDASDKTDAFRIRNGVREGLGESSVAGKLEDAVLGKLVGTVDALIVVETGTGARQHVIHVIVVRGIVVDLEGDIAIGPVVGFLPDLVTAGDERKEGENVSCA